MSLNNRDQYLEAMVSTAPSHKLHRMLLDGAIRFATTAAAAYRSGDPSASHSLLRAIDIVEELVAGVRKSEDQIGQKMSQIYLFIYVTMAEAKIDDDLEKLEEAIRILTYQRETWQLACERLEEQDVKKSDDGLPGSSDGSVLGVPHLNRTNEIVGGSEGLSLEA